jgi:formylmethanofuran dehydrogenase subunit C
MRHGLVLRNAPVLRLDGRGLAPAALCTMTREEVLRLPLPHGRERVPLAEWFRVVSQTDDGAAPRLWLEGDLRRCDCIGAGMAAGTLEVHGPVGDAVGLGMSGGALTVHGSARDLAGCAMRGGALEVLGDVADFAGGALPGAADGMQGGTLVVHGHSGARLGDRMRRGTIAVHGDAGDFAAARLVAGTVVVGGRCGAHAGWGMRRGTVVFAGAVPAVPATFVPADFDAPVFWRLLARDLARLGGRFAALPGRPIARWVGDLAVGGQGEWVGVG